MVRKDKYIGYCSISILEVIMKIRMYECGFGDCFRIMQEGQRDLYVDFGTLQSNSSKSDREEKFKNIINEMNDDKEFLLTHYHLDHFNGVLYMVKQNVHGFRHVYIPDVWNINYRQGAFALLLLRDILRKDTIRIGEKKVMSLLCFFESICLSHSTIHFITRGNKFHNNQFIALWPSKKYVDKKTHDLYKKLGKKFGKEKMNRVKALSVKLIDLLDSYQKNKELDYEHEFNDIKLEFIEIKSMFNDDISLVNTKYVGKQLNELGNEISIVFQNCAGDKNVLFTGDFGKVTNWKFIENNRDGIVYMHQKYNVIKVPHHGTKAYYHSFVDRMSNCSIFLIPNGYNSGSWGIHSKYIDDSFNHNYKSICSCCPKCSGKVCADCNPIKKNSHADV